MQAQPASVGTLPSQEAGEAVNGVKATPEQRATTEAPSAADSGLPQFKLEYWGGQILWLVILFAALYLLLSRVFIPRLRQVKDEREAAIGGAIEEARRVRAEADRQAEETHAEMAEARASAQRTAADAKARAASEAYKRHAVQEAELAEKLGLAEARIAASRDRAMGSVREVASDAVAAIVQRLTGKPASAAEVTAALDAKA